MQEQEREFETDVIEESDNSTDSKIERYQINTFTQDRPIETLLKWYKNGKLILPEFQREFVWSYSNSCRLIESILLNLPIPNIFLFKIKDTEGEKFLLIDGLQRITTINQYVEGTWTQGGVSKKFRVQSPNEKWNRKTFDKLADDDQQFIYDYSIGTTIFESSSGNEIDQSNVIFSVFERINTGSERLSDQEIRNAVYGGDLLSVLKDVILNADYSKLIESDENLQKRGKNIELMLRFIAYKHIFEKAKNHCNLLVDNDANSTITTSKKVMLNNYMFYSNKGAIDYKQELDSVLEAISVICSFEPTAFYGKARSANEIGTKIHEVFAEALVLAVIENDYKISISKDAFIAEKLKLWSEDSLIEPFKYKTTDPETVLKRVDCLLKMIRG